MQCDGYGADAAVVADLLHQQSDKPTLLAWRQFSSDGIERVECPCRLLRVQKFALKSNEFFSRPVSRAVCPIGCHAVIPTLDFAPHPDYNIKA